MAGLCRVKAILACQGVAGSGMITVLVVNPKGGSGKSTIATNMAAAFACGGLRTALADADRQRSSLYWLGLRPKSVAPVKSLDWAKGITDIPNQLDRLVIDSPAGIRGRAMRELLALADVVIVPTLPSPFDEQAAARFVKAVSGLRAVRKKRTAVGIVRNRVRARSRAANHLQDFTAGLGVPDIGEIRDRALYVELVSNGLGVFDLPVPRIESVKSDWYPLLKYVEAAGWRG